MRKILAILLLLAMVLVLQLGLAACGTDETTTTTSTSSATTTGTTTTTTITPVATTRTITDIYGRELRVPAEITSVICTGLVETILMYQVAPDKLGGLSFTFNGELVPDSYKDLPIVGGWFGTQTGNYETFISMKPDIILEGREANLAERQEKFGDIPVVGIESWNGFTEYENAIRFLGELLGEETQAESLIAYYNDALDYVSSIMATVPQNERKTVYYAEGKEGLNTDPIGSQHIEVIEFCGGVNVADVILKEGYGMAEVSFEQILLWDPDIIIIGRGSQVSLYTVIMIDDRFTNMRKFWQERNCRKNDENREKFDRALEQANLCGNIVLEYGGLWIELKKSG